MRSIPRYEARDLMLLHTYTYYVLNFKSFECAPWCEYATTRPYCSTGSGIRRRKLLVEIFRVYLVPDKNQTWLVMHVCVSLVFI